MVLVALSKAELTGAGMAVDLRDPLDAALDCPAVWAAFDEEADVVVACETCSLWAHSWGNVDPLVVILVHLGLNCHGKGAMVSQGRDQGGQAQGRNSTHEGF